MYFPSFILTHVNKQSRFLYVVMICMDANFHLKEQEVSSWSRDPGFGLDWGYWCKQDEFRRYVASKTNAADEVRVPPLNSIFYC